MASGMCPCWADVVQEELLEQLCPNELKEFRDALLECDISTPELLDTWQSHKDDPDIQQDEPPCKEFQILIKTFNCKTGLELDLACHDPENGDRYDEVSVLFFTVRGVYQYTEAGEKFKQFIVRKGWVEFG